MTELKPLVVTTAHRGVFFGYGIATDSENIRLERARMCVYWSEQNKGVLGLASDGPLNGSRIGPAVPAIILRNVTSVMEVTQQAVKRWEAEPWS